MTRTEALDRLLAIRSKSAEAMRLLESGPLTESAQIEVQRLAEWIKAELQSEYLRSLSTRAQKAMSMFELSIYSPSIEETWKNTGISRLKTDSIPDRRWATMLEAVAYKISKYIG